MAKILIADDEKEIVRLLKIYFEAENIQVVEANDGQCAMEILMQENIDIALVDIMMPKVDGYQLIKYIREKMDRYVPVIVISAKVTLSESLIRQKRQKKQDLQGHKGVQLIEKNGEKNNLLLLLMISVLFLKRR